MNIAVIDDYQDAFRTLRCYPKLERHEVLVYNDTEKDPDRLAERLKKAEAVIFNPGALAFSARANRASARAEADQPDRAQHRTHRHRRLHRARGGSLGSRQGHRAPDRRTYLGSDSRRAAAHPIRSAAAERRALAVDGRGLRAGKN